ncbi:MAG: hypothetical protein ACREQN_03310 [Candidatus Binataceae bacterium]
MSLLVGTFGSYRTKVDFDLIPRRHYAYGILRAADKAKSRGLDSVTVAEFGVAAGWGLLNMCEIAKNVSRVTGVEIRIVGFDGGEGLPPPQDYRDHPDLFRAGDYPMDREGLMRTLPSNARLVLGPLKDTVPEFARTLSPQSPLGFASIDVDYYSSAKDAFVLFCESDPVKYLPVPGLYFDDITEESQNSWCGELLAINEFNAEQPLRKIEIDRFLRGRRIFKGGRWIDQIYLLHVLDHPVMQGREIRSHIISYGSIKA